METTTQRTNKSPTTNGSFWGLNTTNILDEYSCTPFESDTIVSKGVKISLYCVLLLFSVLGNSLVIAILREASE